MDILFIFGGILILWFIFRLYKSMGVWEAFESRNRYMMGLDEPLSQGSKSRSVETTTTKSLEIALQQQPNLWYLKCGNCSAEDQVFGLNARENSKLYICKTRETRASDGLDIYALFCFECVFITEYAPDPLNSSGRAIGGIEYFRSYRAEKNSLAPFVDQMRRMNNLSALERIRIKHFDKS